MKSTRTENTEGPSESVLYQMPNDLSDYVAQLEQDINQLNQAVKNGQHL